MEQAKVYFTDFRTTLEENLLQKLARLMATAGMDRINFEGKYVAIKMHFGEPGNLAFLRPNFARAVVDFIKDLGGRPFLTDPLCSTSRRRNGWSRRGRCPESCGRRGRSGAPPGS